MANATKIPSIIFSQWATPSAPNPRLAAPIDSDDTTIIVTSAPLDSSGVAITGDFLMNVKNSNSYVELIYVPAGGVTGTTFTGCVRGIRPTGLDFTTGAAGFTAAHEQDSPVGFAISAIYENIIRAWMQGTLASGGSGIIIGTDADGTVTVSRSTGAGTFAGFLRWNTANDKAQFSNDGAAWVNIDSVAASNLVTVSANDTTPNYLSAKLVSATGGIDFNILNPGADETLNMTVDLSEVDIVPGPLANVISDVATTAAELNNVPTLVAGPASNADALHTHTNLAQKSFTAGQTIDGTPTPKAVTIGAGSVKKVKRVTTPTGINYITGAGVVAKNMGDVDASSRQGQSFVITHANAVSITVTNVKFPILKVNAPVDNTYIEIQTDSGGSPSGVAVANGTSGNVAGGGIATTFTFTTYTFAVAPTLTSGTTYWVVMRRSGANDAVNHYGLNSLTGSGAKSYTASSGLWAAIAGKGYPMDINYTVNYGGRACLSAYSDGPLGRVHGFATTDAAAAGDAVTVQLAGEVTGLAGLNPGDTYFVSTSGNITNSPTTISNTAWITGASEMYSRVGVALSTTSLLLKPLECYAGGEYSDPAGIATGGAIYLGGNAASSGTVFIETGFRPERIRINTQWRNTAGNTVNASGEFVGGVAIDDTEIYFVDATGAGSAGPAIIRAGAAGLIGPDSSNNLTVSTLYSNGFDLTVTSSQWANYHPNYISWSAQGY